MSEKLTLEINGKEFEIKDQEVFDLLINISLERDMYRDFIEGKIVKSEVLLAYPTIGLNSN